TGEERARRSSGNLPPKETTMSAPRISVCAMILGVLSLPAMGFGQGPAPQPPPGFGPVPLPPAPVAAPGPYVPVTVVLSLDALNGKALQALPPAPLPPPPPGPGVFPGKKPGGLLDKIREKKPLQKLLAALGDKQEVLKELEKISRPVNLD